MFGLEACVPRRRGNVCGCGRGQPWFQGLGVGNVFASTLKSIELVTTLLANVIIPFFLCPYHALLERFLFLWLCSQLWPSILCWYVCVWHACSQAKEVWESLRWGRRGPLYFILTWSCTPGPAYMSVYTPCFLGAKTMMVIVMPCPTHLRIS